MKISWTPPAFDGGTPIISYLIEYKDVSSANWIRVKSSDTTILFNNLHEETNYQFRVSAENQIGSGSFSVASDMYKTIGRL